MSEQWSEEPTGGLLLHCRRVRAQHRWASARRQQRAHLLQRASEWLLRAGRSNQDLAPDRRAPSSKLDCLSSPSCALKAADFSSSIELDHFISAHTRKGPFLLSVLAYQSLSQKCYVHQRTELQFSPKWPNLVDISWQSQLMMRDYGHFSHFFILLWTSILLPINYFPAEWINQDGSFLNIINDLCNYGLFFAVFL